MFGYQKTNTLLSYKKNKYVILLSSLHHDVSIDLYQRKKLPEIISFYNMKHCLVHIPLLETAGDDR